MADRRSTTPKLTIPDKASFEDADLDENADLPALRKYQHHSN